MTDKSNLSLERQSIQRSRQRIKARINETIAMLEKADAMPANQPWISMNRISRVEDLKGKHFTLREALEADLRILRIKMRELNESDKQKQARVSSRRFGRTIIKALNAMDERGYYTEGEKRKIKAAAQKAMIDGARLLNEYPSGKNIKSLLFDMADCERLGLGSSLGVIWSGAWGAVKHAETKLFYGAQKSFRNKPTVENFDRYLINAAAAERLGVKTNIQSKPPPRKKKGIVHVVSKGDTLSRISLEFYGKPGYWDKIYFANAKAIGNNIKNLKVGLKLNIP